VNGVYVIGDLVAEFLAACGVTTAFGIISVHNIPILNAISRRNSCRFVMARGEMGAAHMADAYARVTGGLGVLVSSTGPGAANAVSGLAEARIASAPLLHLTGQTPTKYIGRRMGVVHDMADQFSMLSAVSKTAYRVQSTSEVLDVLSLAVSEALSPPRGPVSVEIPIDIQKTAIARPSELKAPQRTIPPHPPSSDAMEALSQAALAARRPMLWLGSGARDAREPANRLLDLGFRAVTSWAGRGVIPEDDPRTWGALNGLGLPDIQEFYQTVDLMIVVGSRLRGHETLDFSVKLPANLAQIDIDPAAEGRTYPTAIFVEGDAQTTLAILADRLQGHMKIDATFSSQFEAAGQNARRFLKETLGPYASFPGQLRAAMPRGTIWVRDITTANTAWGNRLMPIYDPSENVYSIGAGIGMGLPHGVGAAMAASGKRKTVVLSGDGGFAVNMTELWTAVQERLDLVIIIMNDNGYGVIRHIQDAEYGGHHCFDVLTGPNFSELAKLANVPFWRVTHAEDLGHAVSAALEISGPSFVEVDVAAIGPIPPYYPYNRRRPIDKKNGEPATGPA
jgi:acetolactate synthase I/II/III large subunit